MKDFWNQRYSEPDFAYGSEPNTYFKSIIDRLPPGKMLVPGAGEGRDAVYAAQLGWEVVAFDQSEVGRQKAIRLAKEKGVEIAYEVADVEHFTNHETFNAIVLIFFHLPPVIRQNLHKRIKSWLSPGGYVISETFSLKQLQNNSGGPKDPTLLISCELLASELAFLQILDNKEEQILLDEGPYHQGLADVVRFHGVMQ